MHPVHGMCKKLSKRSAVSKVKAFDEEKHERDHNKKFRGFALYGEASFCIRKTPRWTRGSVDAMRLTRNPPSLKM